MSTQITHRKIKDNIYIVLILIVQNLKTDFYYRLIDLKEKSIICFIKAELIVKKLDIKFDDSLVNV